MDPLNCQHCRYSAINAPALGRHYSTYGNGGLCTLNYGVRVIDHEVLPDASYAEEEFPDDPVDDHPYLSDPEPDPEPEVESASEDEDQDRLPDRPFDTNTELILLLGRGKLSAAEQQDFLDLLLHPDFDVSQVQPFNSKCQGLLIAPKPATGFASHHGLKSHDRIYVHECWQGVFPMPSTRCWGSLCSSIVH